MCLVLFGGRKWPRYIGVWVNRGAVYRGFTVVGCNWGCWKILKLVEHKWMEQEVVCGSGIGGFQCYLDWIKQRMLKMNWSLRDLVI